jgi:3'-phosphoadenosine 5'-phosphosulfate sulfotransferase (PAPS reductase)/FAD synthetase
MSDKEPRHILNISGGKDSSALAIFMRDRVQGMEYVFCDTQKELPETYEYLDKLEVYLGKKIVRLNAERGFDHWLKVYGGYLPSSRMRWCTRQLKIKPLEDYVGTDNVVSYVGIRADEDREGYISTKPNIRAVFPFKEHGLTKTDVFRILDESGVGVPSYYAWRSRSGCYFCFFQQQEEWLGLKENHPELFVEAKSYEKLDTETGQSYQWSQSLSLEELADPLRAAQIRSRANSRRTASKGSSRLLEVLQEQDDLDPEDRACLVCDL